MNHQAYGCPALLQSFYGQQSLSLFLKWLAEKIRAKFLLMCAISSGLRFCTRANRAVLDREARGRLLEQAVLFD